MPRSKRPSRQEAEIATSGDMLNLLSEMLVKQTHEPNLLAYTPHPKQAAFHSSDKHIRAFIGGNRSGKSVAGVVEDLWWCTKRHPYRKLPPGPIRGRIVVNSFTDGFEKAILPLIRQWIVPSDLINGSWEDSWDNELRTLFFKNKSFLEIMSTEQDLEKHAGVSRHFIHGDEEMPQAYYRENLLRILDTAGYFWMTLTPVEGMTWTYDDIYEPWASGIGNEDTAVFTVSVDENPYISEAAKNLIFGAIDDQDEYNTRRHGIFASKGGLIFPDFKTEVHSQIPEGWRPSPQAVAEGLYRIYVSIDHGINNPTAIYWHSVDRNGQVVTFHEYYRAQLLVRDHAAYIREYNAAWGIKDDWVYIYTGDPSMKQRNGVTGTSIMQAYGEEGYNLALELLTKDVKTGIDRMRLYLRLNKYGNPTWRLVKGACPNLERELRRLHWKVLTSARLRDSTNVTEEVHKKDDHGFDSCRYFFTFMPDLSADDLWKPGQNDEVKLIDGPGSYVHTAAEMNFWQPVSTGASTEVAEYSASEVD